MEVNMSTPSRLYLYKRPNGFYYVGYWSGGRRKWKSTKARHKVDALKSLTELKALLQPKPPSGTLSDFIAQYERFIETNCTPKTVTNYRSVLKLFRLVVKDIALTEVTPLVVDQYRADRLGRVSAETVNMELRTLKAAFNKAKGWGLLDHNPIPRSAKATVASQPPAYFSMDDLKRLLAAIKEDWLKEMVVFAVMTGMRRGEIVNLNWGQIDLSRRVVHVHSHGAFQTKGGKQRVVPLNEPAVQLLLTRRAVQSNCEYVFTLNGQKILDSWASHKLKFYIRDAKIGDGRLHFHSLRHTFATMLVRSGVSLYDVQKILGHSSISVTEQYAHLCGSDLHSRVNVLALPSIS
jgi:integrase